MKKGIHYWALPHALSLRGKMRFAKASGFDGLELVVVEHGELSPGLGKGELAAIRQMAKEEQVELVALSSSLNWNCSLTSEDGEIRKKAKEALVRQMEMAAALGIEVALALPGFVTVDFMAGQLHPFVDTCEENQYHPGRETVDYETAYGRALQAFGQLSPIARQLGVVLGVENIWNHFLLSPLEMAGFIDAIGSSHVSAYFDVGNVMPWGRPEQWIRILGSRIKRVHVKDYKKGCSSVEGFVNLLNGDIDFVEVVKALRQAGYDGWLTAEACEKPGFPEFATKASALALEEILREGGNGHV